jgi:ABC-type dipeptide/oligopeptide/nickel transport system ATPase component
VIFQSAAATLNPLLRIGTQLKQVLKANRPDLSSSDVDDRMRRVLTRMGFTDPDRILRAYPHHLSGGMRQRASIAIAVAPEPDVIIADECTSALDVLVQADVIDLLRELVDELDTAMLFVTHDLMLAADLCTHVSVMRHGKVVESGPAAAIMRAPQHEYTRALLDAVPAWVPSTDVSGAAEMTPGVSS